MMLKSILPLCVVLASSVGVLGCLASEGTDDQETLGMAQQAALTANALTANALTANALTANALTANALTANALTANALTDPNAQEVFKYIVSCALPATASVDLTIAGVDYSYPGELGLYPKWGNPGGHCNTACQEWVSACVLARLDYLGDKVTISARGAQTALAPTPAELATYTYREGAYFGNLFLDTPVYAACVAPGRSGLPRVCGPTLDDCVIDVVGSCSSVCTGSSGFGTFMNCADQAKVNGQYPAGTRTYPTAITVFLDP